MDEPEVFNIRTDASGAWEPMVTKASYDALANRLAAAEKTMPEEPAVFQFWRDGKTNLEFVQYVDDLRTHALSLAAQLAEVKGDAEKIGRIGGMMANLCFNGKQMDSVPDSIRRNMAELQAEWDREQGKC